MQPKGKEKKKKKIGNMRNWDAWVNYLLFVEGCIRVCVQWEEIWTSLKKKREISLLRVSLLLPWGDTKGSHVSSSILCSTDSLGSLWFPILPFMSPYPWPRYNLMWRPFDFRGCAIDLWRVVLRGEHMVSLVLPFEWWYPFMRSCKKISESAFILVIHMWPICFLIHHSSHI